MQARLSIGHFFMYKTGPFMYETEFYVRTTL